MSNRKNITEQHSPQANSRYPSELFQPLMKTSFVWSKYWANKFVNLSRPISPAFNFEWKRPENERDSLFSRQAWERGWPGTTGNEADSGVEMKRRLRNAKHTLNRRLRLFDLPSLKCIQPRTVDMQDLNKPVSKTNPKEMQ